MYLSNEVILLQLRFGSEIRMQLLFEKIHSIKRRCLTREAALRVRHVGLFAVQRGVCI